MESFSIYEYIYPGLTVKRIKELSELIIQQKNLYLNYNHYFENREILIAKAIKYALAYTQFSLAQDLCPVEKEYLSSFFPEITGLSFAEYFSNSFYYLASSKQISHYKHLIDSYQIIGSYSQSELGNGSDLRRIETQAIYDKDRQVFIINSPTITSAKFWIGGLGIVSNHTILIAKLIIDNVDYGPHPFLMQIRNLRTHKPVPGCFLGEIGPKMGMDSCDNGFGRFEFVIVPKVALLNRFWNIDEHGQYTKKLDPLNVLTMTHVTARVNLAKAC